jgi:hypothetical protein
MTEKSSPDTYTKPELRERIKKKVMAGSKGGNPGQWSARKAQLVAQAYEKEGGGYKKSQNESQKSLKKWEDEKWTTSDGKQARRSEGTARYLPEKAWENFRPLRKRQRTRRSKRDREKANSL